MPMSTGSLKISFFGQLSFLRRILGAEHRFFRCSGYSAPLQSIRKVDLRGVRLSLGGSKDFILLSCPSAYSQLGVLSYREFSAPSSKYSGVGGIKAAFFLLRGFFGLQGTLFKTILFLVYFF